MIQSESKPIKCCTSCKYSNQGDPCLTVTLTPQQFTHTHTKKKHCHVIDCKGRTLGVRIPQYKSGSPKTTGSCALVRALDCHWYKNMWNSCYPVWSQNSVTPNTWDKATKQLQCHSYSPWGFPLHDEQVQKIGHLSSTLFPWEPTGTMFY